MSNRTVAFLPTVLLALVATSIHAQTDSVPGELADFTVDVDIEQPPFRYSKTDDDNPVSRWIDRLDSGEASLESSSKIGYLRAILEALDVSPATQTLVFSRTSLQVNHISRRNPRALYFNDDVYVGWIRGSPLMEISTADPKLGAAFYTVDTSIEPPRVKRESYTCLGCHATSMTQRVPGHTMRSVFTDFTGNIQSQRAAYITDDTSPLSERWGGWYVTGQHGDMTHMGNASGRSGEADNGNLQSLSREFNTLDYLRSSSDIVALMVLGHQTQMHNVMTRADFSVRQWQYERETSEADDAPGTTSGGDPDSAPEAEVELQTRIEATARQVVRSLLFCDEAQLTDEVKGSILFAKSFTRRGPEDQQGRSLREFDLKTRLFRYPCSYLIYSDAFSKLSEPLRQEILRQLHAVLSGTDKSREFEHLSDTLREEILEILIETHDEFRSVDQARSIQARGKS